MLGDAVLGMHATRYATRLQKAVKLIRMLEALGNHEEVSMGVYTSDYIHITQSNGSNFTA